MFIHGCESAGSVDSSGQFNPGTGAAAFQISGLDRAFFGTQDNIVTDDYKWSEGVWALLGSGMTLYDTELQAQLWDPLTGMQYEASSPHSVYARIIGDGKMTLT